MERDRVGEKRGGKEKERKKCRLIAWKEIAKEERCKREREREREREKDRMMERNKTLRDK